MAALGKGIQKSSFGRLADGTEIELYTLTNSGGMSCKIITYGGIVTEVLARDREGKLGNIVLGHERLEDYVADTAYLGAIIGRVANRIANASFELNGKTYTLTANEGENHLHGGVSGFNRRVWRATPLPHVEDASIALEYCSPDGEEGYPGTLNVKVTFALTDQNELCLTYKATTDQPTPVNLTSHPYWNLAGGGDILGHELTVLSDFHTAFDRYNIPTGKMEKVDGTPLDFRKPAKIGNRLCKLEGNPPGYNVNYVLKPTKNGLALAAHAQDRASGRTLEIWTDQPGLQFYSGTYLSKPYAGFCLEPQKHPDSVNKRYFPSCIAEPGNGYWHCTVCRFGTA